MEEAAAQKGLQNTTPKKHKKKQKKKKGKKKNGTATGGGAPFLDRPILKRDESQIFKSQG